ncbi:glycoside hydrolase family 16 protein [Aeromicrobium stalagmiti]|uniref:glycoside hydrolase family 16 protein n=1 Tax=Aeromicrobium stalagmiti TaxID=2738988 RepID=UPI00156905F4|nr:glycoside hydrolase family 16 protein [Aeromicrobium stalagmiti]NRQ51093.1 glycoside hydrolase family 16 protein [Aeromicrobium stalagmiti]
MTTATAAVVAVHADAVIYVKNPDFTRSSAFWTASAHATKARVKVTIDGKKAHAGQVKTRTTRKPRTVRLTSSLSPTQIPVAGTHVHAAARVWTSAPGTIVSYRAYALQHGKVVSSARSRTTAPRGWFWVGAELRTTRARTRIKVSAALEDARTGQLLRVTDVNVTVTPPVVPTVGARCEDVSFKDPAQGDLTYSDEFNGAGLDPREWRVRDNTFLNHDAAFIAKKNVSVHDGYLDIRGRREPRASWRSNPNALYGEENRVRSYSTGYVDSIKNKTYESADAASDERFSQRYGHFEARMWVPSEATMSRGIWPAFWLRADHQAGEIDAMESYGGPTIRSFDPSSSYEWNSWGDTAEGSMTGIEKQQTHGRADVGTDKIWQGWHTYAVNWSPRCLRYLYDGRTVGLVDFDDPSTKPYFRGPTFADTFHIRFNLQIGSKYWGWPDPARTRDQFSFRIDYVRVYQGKELDASAWPAGRRRDRREGAQHDSRAHAEAPVGGIPGEPPTRASRLCRSEHVSALGFRCRSRARTVGRVLVVIEGR